MIQLKTNVLLRGLIPLERSFDLNDRNRNPSIQPEWLEEEDWNLGIDWELKYVKLSKSLSSQEKKRYVNLFKELKGFFAWKYEDLKTYETYVLKHKITMNHKVEPFRQKEMQVNPLLKLLIQGELKKLPDAKILIIV